MAKKKSDTQKLIAFGMAATADQLNAAIESLQAIRDSRFATTARKPRADKGTKREPTAPESSNA